jgi:S-adenosylmethionine synthetase
MKHIITSESVSAWHPDKMCDQISDAILDAYLTKDPLARVACECLVTTDTLIIAGEITSQAHVDHIAVARNTINTIWYDRPDLFFDGHTCQVTDLIHTQSPDIAMGVDVWWAGDQGIMYGYASDETPELMPAPIMYAHKLARELHHLRTNHIISYLRPDAKTQVSVVYDEDRVIRIDTVVVSTQHDPDIAQEQIHTDIKNQLILPVLGDLIDDQTIFFINPTGQFIVWWPHGDTGLTGRKIIVDTYWWVGRHGGWAFSGKDPTKVDRSAAYMARYLAKYCVSKWYCRRCEIQLWYAIGVVQPVSLYVNCFDTQTKNLTDIIQDLKQFDCSPKGIIQFLDLRRPIYQQTASYGHFGRKEFSREQIA